MAFCRQAVPDDTRVPGMARRFKRRMNAERDLRHRHRSSTYSSLKGDDEWTDRSASEPGGD